MSRKTPGARAARGEVLAQLPDLVGARVPEQRGRACPIDGGAVEHRYETAGIAWFRCRDCGSEMPGSTWAY